MRITVTGSNKNIHLRVPTSLIFSKASAWIAVTMGRKYAGDSFPNLSVEDMERLLAEFRHIKRTHKDWCLVEVESNSGSYVRVTL